MKNDDLTRAQLIERIHALQETINSLEKKAATQKQTEDALSASEKNLSAILEKNPDGIVIVDVDGAVLYVNPAAEKLFDKKKQDFLGYPFGFPVSADKAEDSLIIRKGDMLCEAKLRVVQVQWENRPAFQLSVRDITERKQAEKELGRLNRILQAKSRSSEAMMRAVDERGYLNEVCRIIVEDCGHALVWIGFAEDDEGKTVRQVAYAGFEEGYLESMKITWADTDRGRGPVGTAIRTGKPSLSRNILTNSAFAPWREEALKRGYASVIGVPLLADRKILGSLNIYSREKDPFSDDEVRLLSDLAADLSYGIAAIRNRAAQAEAESALQKSQEKYRAIVENATDQIFALDREKRYISVNKIMENLFEKKADEMVGKFIRDLYPMEIADQFSRNIDEVFKTGESKSIEEKMIVRDKEFWISTQLNPIKNNAGEVNAVMGIVRDITGHRKLEEQIRHAQKMEAIGTLAGGVAHDFNNILNVIMGYGGMMLENLAPGSPSREQMHEVLAAADRAAALTRRLLIFSRKQVAEVKPVDINGIISSVQKMLSRIIGEDIDLQFDLADKSRIVMVDSGQIEQVLMNLATNARDAMPKGGHLTITTETAHMDDAYVAAYGYGKPGTYVVIAVTDTGKGIDAKTQKKIFEPFFTTKGIGEGTGLGLAISYEIVKQHNGYIRCYSETGRGTAFKIYLPLIDDKVAFGMKVEAPVAIKGGTETILVAEDDPSLSKLTRIVLESSGYSVIIAENGEEAVEKYRENKDRIQLVVLDLIMPKKSGKEAYDEIRAMSPEVRVFFLSGYTMDMISRMDVEEGMEVVRKPYAPKDLLRKVREVLDK